MDRLKTNFLGIEFKNPIIASSGTFGFGKEYSIIYDLSKLGGICISAITAAARDGNQPPRIAETPMGMLNSVGLQNPGVDAFIKDELPGLQKYDTILIANIAGFTIEEFINVVEKLNETNIDILEINLSCPNVKSGGMAFGIDPKNVYSITKEIKRYTKIPVMVKLTPNVTDITILAKAAEDAGADAVSLINTLLGMRIDIKTKKPVLNNNVGGLSGPAVFPVALRMVWQAADAVKIPVFGIGGVTKGEDAVEMMLAGAALIGVGTANFSDPYAPVKIIDYLDQYCIDNKLSNISDIVGKVILN